MGIAEKHKLSLSKAVFPINYRHNFLSSPNEKGNFFMKRFTVVRIGVPFSTAREIDSKMKENSSFFYLSDGLFGLVPVQNSSN